MTFKRWAKCKCGLHMWVYAGPLTEEQAGLIPTSRMCKNCGKKQAWKTASHNTWELDRWKTIKEKK